MLKSCHRFAIRENAFILHHLPANWQIPRSSADEKTKEAFLGYKDYRVRNARYLSTVLMNIAEEIAPLFAGVSKIAFLSKITDATQRKQALGLTDAIARQLQKHLNWVVIAADEIRPRLTYQAVVLTICKRVLLDGTAFLFILLFIPC